MTSGMSITFPPGALENSGCAADPCPIVAKGVPASDAQAVMADLLLTQPDWEDVKQASSFYDMEPPLTFAKPVTVCMKTVNGSASAQSEVYQV